MVEEQFKARIGGVPVPRISHSAKEAGQHVGLYSPTAWNQTRLSQLVVCVIIFWQFLCLSNSRHISLRNQDVCVWELILIISLLCCKLCKKHKCESHSTIPDTNRSLNFLLTGLNISHVKYYHGEKDFLVHLRIYWEEE